MFPESGPVWLRTNLGDHKVVMGLKDGTVSSKLVRFDFCGPKAAHLGFKSMLRERLFDAGELAIVTYLQARASGTPLLLLPAVVLGGPLHQCLRIDASRQKLTPKDLEGSVVGVRSYTQTTGVWLRGILEHEYGLDLKRVTWGTMEDSHLAEFHDPPDCRRLPTGTLEGLLADGTVDAIIVGRQAGQDSRTAALISDAPAAARSYARAHHMTPINHMFAIDQALSEQRPDVVREIWRLLVASRQQAGEVSDLCYGVEPNRRALEAIITYSFEQGILPRPLGVDELFDATTRTLAEV